MRIIRYEIQEFNGSGLCTCIGGGRTAPDRAAFYNSALIRYLDFNDSYLAPRETCHPSDNLGAVLVVLPKIAMPGGANSWPALAVSYQVQCRLSEAAPVRDKGFDHTTQGAYAVPQPGLRARCASILCGRPMPLQSAALPSTRSGSHAPAFYPIGRDSRIRTRLSARRIRPSLPRAESPGRWRFSKGTRASLTPSPVHFKSTGSGRTWKRVTRTIVKKFNAEIHSQSAIEGALELQKRHGFAAGEVDRVEIEIFHVAHRIIGGGEEGGKKIVETKEQADHSLPFLLAVALLDDQVMPAQYRPERIRRDDVQKLLQRIEVRPNQSYSARFPAEMVCSVEAALKDGRSFKIMKTDYEGFVTRPVLWQGATDKFRRLAGAYCDGAVVDEIIGIVAEMENAHVRSLMRILERVRLA